MNKLFLFPFMALLTSCASVPHLPPISDSGQFQPGKFIWRDLITPHPDAAQLFYGELLGWEFEVLANSGYTLIRHRGELIGGMVDANRIGQPVKSALWLSAVSVPDAGEAVRSAVQAGGQVIHKPRKLPDRGRVAVIKDRDGAVLQFVQTSGGDPMDAEPVMNQWLWTELITGEPAGAAEFYQAVIGYEVTINDAGYRLLLADGKPRGGIVENPFDDTRSAWIPYIRVGNAAEASARAVELGGRLVVEPREEIRGGTVALILDPSGAPVALQQWAGELKEGN